MADLTTPLPVFVREILSGVLHDFEGHIRALRNEPTEGLQDIYDRWVDRMADDLEPLRKLLEADKKLRGET